MNKADVEALVGKLRPKTFVVDATGTQHIKFMDVIKVLCQHTEIDTKGDVVERVAKAICKYEHGPAGFAEAWASWHANFESIAEIAIAAYEGEVETGRGESLTGSSPIGSKGDNLASPTLYADNERNTYLGTLPQPNSESDRVESAINPKLWTKEEAVNHSLESQITDLIIRSAAFIRENRSASETAERIANLFRPYLRTKPVSVSHIMPDIGEYDPTNESFEDYRKYVIETVLDAAGVQYVED